MERTLDLLFAIERSSHSPGVSELARATGMPKATALRLLGVLERRGLVQKENARYQLGPGLVPLARGFLAGSSLTRAASPALEELTALSGETACLYVRQGEDRVVIQRVEAPHALRYNIRVGQRLPLYTGASGLVLAAAMPEDELQRMLDQHPVITLATGEQRTREMLLALLEKVRREGVVVSRQERELGVISIAAPVVRPDGGAIAAVAVLGPPDRMTDDKVALLSLEVRRAGRDIGESYSRF